MIQAIFIGFVVLTVVSALFILFTRNVMYAALALFLTFLGVAALYVFMGADFLAVTQLLIYVGGVLILIIFGIMLTHRSDNQQNEQKNRVLTSHKNHLKAAVVACGVFGLMVWLILSNQFTNTAVITQQTTLHLIGTGIMTDYVLPFEIIGILLLVGLVGAAYLAKGFERK